MIKSDKHDIEFIKYKSDGLLPEESDGFYIIKANIPIKIDRIIIFPGDTAIIPTGIALKKYNLTTQDIYISDNFKDLLYIKGVTGFFQDIGNEITITVKNITNKHISIEDEDNILKISKRD